MASDPNVMIITPTYNEHAALPDLIQRIASLGIPHCTVVVVDDNSPDGTGALADDLAKAYPIHVIHRPRKEGLGKAYVQAFMKLLTLPPETRPTYVIQMDADLSHNPADIPRFLEKIESCDVVLGSRYVRGGSIENWDAIRRFISRFGNIYASLALGLPFRDLTSGYKCFRFEVLKELDFMSISSIGYNFQIETTYRAYKKGFRICEIPIIFTERKTGMSKFNIGIILESFWKVLLLRLGK